MGRGIKELKSSQSPEHSHTIDMFSLEHTHTQSQRKKIYIQKEIPIKGRTLQIMHTDIISVL